MPTILKKRKGKATGPSQTQADIIPGNKGALRLSLSLSLSPPPPSDALPRSFAGSLARGACDHEGLAATQPAADGTSSKRTELSLLAQDPHSHSACACSLHGHVALAVSQPMPWDSTHRLQERACIPQHSNARQLETHAKLARCWAGLDFNIGAETLGTGFCLVLGEDTVRLFP